MENLKQEMIEMLDIFDEFQIPEEKQRKIITDGQYYCFSFGTDRSGIDREFDCFKVARLLKFCKENNVAIDAKKLTGSIYDYQEYQELIHSFDKMDKMLKSKEKKKTR